MPPIDSGLTNLITAIAALTGVIIAGIGLSTWKKQMRGTTEYELAKRLMLEVYQLREAIRSTRNPFVAPGEADKDSTDENWEISAYGKRWNAVHEVIARYKLTSLEAEVVWGDITKEPSIQIDKVLRKLNIALIAFARHKKDSSTSDHFYEHFEETLYDLGDDDVYNTALNAAVESYEAVLKQYLRK